MVIMSGFYSVRPGKLRADKVAWTGVTGFTFSNSHAYKCLRFICGYRIMFLLGA